MGKALREKAKNIYRYYMGLSRRECVLIIAPAPDNGQFGISTYIKTVLDSLHNSNHEIILLNIEAGTLKFDMIDDIVIIDVPRLNILMSDDIRQIYGRSIFYYTASIINRGIVKTCHINIYGYECLIDLFKCHWDTRIITTVHYTFWGLNMEGDIRKMQKLLASDYNTLNTRNAHILKKISNRKRDSR